jgi:hypothetical protein
MVSKEILSLSILLGLAFLLLILASQFTDPTVVRPRVAIKEAFEDAPVTGRLETVGADADLTNPRTPYHLLKGVLPDAEKDAPSGLTAERCYQLDFSKRLEKTHNYIQRTNNYRHEAPDSCSAPFSDLVNSFYKVDMVS